MPIVERDQIEDTRSTTLKSWGTSQGIRIPKQVCTWVGIERDSSLTMETGSDKEGRYILLRPLVNDEHKHYGGATAAVSIEELFEGYSGNYLPHEIDWGPDMGHEVIE